MYTNCTCRTEAEHRTCLQIERGHALLMCISLLTVVCTLTLQRLAVNKHETFVFIDPRLSTGA